MECTSYFNNAQVVVTAGSDGGYPSNQPQRQRAAALCLCLAY
ncbi:MAG: hypothetical protein ACLVGW_00515 [Evtepia gabavorous]